MIFKNLLRWKPRGRKAAAPINITLEPTVIPDGALVMYQVCMDGLSQEQHKQMSESIKRIIGNNCKNGTRFLFLPYSKRVEQRIVVVPPATPYETPQPEKPAPQVEPTTAP